MMQCELEVLVHFLIDLVAAGQLNDGNGLDGVVVLVEGVGTGDALGTVHVLDGVDDSLLVFVSASGQALLFGSLQTSMAASYARGANMLGISSTL